MNADARNAFRQIGTAVRENLHAGTVVVSLAGNTSDSLAVSIMVAENAPRLSGSGQMERMEPCVVHVRKALLPVWATVDAMAGAAKITADGKHFKVSGARDLGHTIRLSCIRWPDDAD